ncbi:MAG: GntR family transcriptional regulator [Chloroflexi bacterium]|nr:GntR family transcriptional regulator [Chloroflexota bacterium]
MQIRIQPNSPLPVHVQLKEQIKFLILNGELAPAARLPTARQLAGFLRINRNTVLRAYQALVQEGLIECKQGRGCVVVEFLAPVAPPASTALLKIIDRAIEEAGELGVRPDDFATFAYARAMQRMDVRVRRHVVFVECEPRIAAALAQAIQEKLAVKAIPVTLQDLQQPTAEVEEYLREAHVVATTFFHIQEVRQQLARTKKEVVGLGVRLPLDQLVQISNIPASTPVAMICATYESALNMKHSLENAGIKGLDARICGVDDPKKLAESLRGVSMVIASDLVAQKVEPLLEPNQKLIVLNYLTLDEGGLNMLRSIVEGS